MSSGARHTPCPKMCRRLAAARRSANFFVINCEAAIIITQVSLGYFYTFFAQTLTEPVMHGMVHIIMIVNTYHDTREWRIPTSCKSSY